MTPFRFEHDFRAASAADVFTAYFDPEHIAEQDRRTEMVRRDVLELEDGPDQLRRVCKVVPRRQLPAILRPFIPGELGFVERLVWHKADDRIDMTIEPSLLGGRTEIIATYALVPAGPGLIRRVYEGHVTVEIRLIGRRIEAAILDDLGRSLEGAAQGTQAWLDHHRPTT
ncbi:MAG: DUF2505 domain-containing protein [Kofleriaceae bacterium]|nr:DUF2505 domain-containing protein [Myxococcales bacterium]MCB9560339.1 DUF2505 domain-containing protein [Kofleriaceae bacterium]MCB9571731.1 DUF2505 domain-containing protein [Kofleriaceae bacterium]